MSTNKNIAIAFVSFLLGSGVGFIVGQKMLEKKYADIAQEEIDSVKERLRKTRGTLRPSDPNTAVRTEEASEFKRHGPDVTRSRSSLDGTWTSRADELKKKYNIISDGEPEEDDGGMTEDDHTDLRKIDRTQPYIISDEEFSDEFDHHDKLSLYYYVDDDVLCDEEEDIVDDIEDYCGYDALAALDKTTTVWVRNEPMSSDFEIIRINKSYAETVHGIGIGAESPKEKQARLEKENK